MVSGMYKLKDSLLFDDTNPSHSFLLWYCHFFTGALEGAVCGWFKEIWRVLCLFEKGNCSPAYLFHWTSGSNFPLLPPHSFMITAQELNFPLRISSANMTKSAVDQITIPADLVTFTEERLNRKLHFLCSG